MKKYTKEEFLKAAELGEVSMIDAKYIVSLLDKAKITTRKEYQKQYQKTMQRAAKRKRLKVGTIKSTSLKYAKN